MQRDAACACLHGLLKSSTVNDHIKAVGRPGASTQGGGDCSRGLQYRGLLRQVSAQLDEGSGRGSGRGHKGCAPLRDGLGALTLCVPSAWACSPACG